MVLDGVGLAFGAFGLVWSTATILRVQPSFEKMLSDSESGIPAFTRLCLTPALAVALGSGPLLVAPQGILRHTGERGRAIRMAVAVFLTLLAPGIIRSGLFLPIPRVSAGIR